MGDAPTASAAVRPLLIISLHDVAPPFEAEIRAQVGELARIGVSRFVAKIVPNWHGGNQVSAHSGFRELLTGLEGGGVQTVLHGYEHRTRGPVHGSPIRVARAQLFARGTAEFMTVSNTQARDSIARGWEEFAACGLAVPNTFCAPGWLMTDEAEDAIVESGIRYLTGMFTLHDLHRLCVWPIAAEGYMGAGGLQEGGVQMLNGLVRLSARDRFAHKIYLHPDLSGRQGWMGSIRRAASLLSQGWTAGTFADLAARGGDPPGE
jgi:predicted deacetylase